MPLCITFISLVFVYCKASSIHTENTCQGSTKFSWEVLSEVYFDIPLPDSEEEWDRYCRYLETRTNCVDFHISEKFGVEQKDLFRIIIFKAEELAQKLCFNETYKRNYLSMATCLLEKNETGCGEILQKSAIALKNNLSIENTVLFICCSWEYFVQCNYKRAKSCKFGDFIVDLLYSIVDPLYNIHCSGYELHTGRCSASGLVAFKSLNTVVGMWALVKRYFVR